MKVLKNNYNNEKVSSEKVVLPYPRVCICNKCKSELSYEKSDLRMGTYGCQYLDCILCGYDNMLEDNEDCIALTKDNIEFPTHFHRFSTETGAVNTLTDDYVREVVREAIDYFRMYKEESFYYSATGNTIVFVFKISGDEEYQVYVTSDYYNTYIPFESCDY